MSYYYTRNIEFAQIKALSRFHNYRNISFISLIDNASWVHGVSPGLFGLRLSSFKLYECARKDNHSVNQKWLNITDKTDYLILALQEIKKGTKINRIFFEISLIWVQILRVLFKLYNFSYELLLNNIFCSFFCFKETEFSKIKAWVIFFLTSSLCLVKTCSSNVDKRIMNVFSWSFVSICLIHSGR